MTSTNRIRPVLGLSLAAALIALTACGGGDDSAGAPASDEESTSEESPDSGLEGIPDVVAEVNGEEVTKEEFAVLYEAQLQQVAAQAQAGGEQPDEKALKKQTADSLVDTELLAQEAAARDIAVTDEDVDAELTSLAQQNQMASGEELLAALEEQGTTEDEARSQVESQLVIEQLVADEAGPVKPTDAELRTIYRQAKQQQEAATEQGGQAQEIPPFAQVRKQLVEQARSNRLNEVAQTLVDDLRKSADITINL